MFLLNWWQGKKLKRTKMRLLRKNWKISSYFDCNGFFNWLYIDTYTSDAFTISLKQIILSICEDRLKWKQDSKKAIFFLFCALTTAFKQIQVLSKILENRWKVLCLLTKFRIFFSFSFTVCIPKKNLFCEHKKYKEGEKQDNWRQNLNWQW